MNKYLVSAEQFDRLLRSSLESMGVRGIERDRTLERCYPIDGRAVLFALNIRGVDAKPSDLIEHVEDPTNGVRLVDGVAQFYRSDVEALFGKLAAAKRFTAATLDRITRGATAEHDLHTLEVEARNINTERLNHACRN